MIGGGVPKNFTQDISSYTVLAVLLDVGIFRLF